MWCTCVAYLPQLIAHSEQRSKTIDGFLTTAFSCSGSAGLVASLAWLEVTNSHMPPPPKKFSPDLHVSHGCVFLLQNAGKSAKTGKISSLVMIICMCLCACGCVYVCVCDLESMLVCLKCSTPCTFHLTSDLPAWPYIHKLITTYGFTPSTSLFLHNF